MTDQIIIDIPRNLEPGTYEYKSVIHKTKNGKLLFDTGTLVSESRAVLTDPAVVQESGGIDFGLIFVSFFVVSCGIGFVFLITRGGRQ
ncbi:MAG: hypothetical protein IPJ84_18965 [Bdellovibrionales bacterium]|nr:hypothetical protein [Bdellovibrionales bacterium]